MESSHKGTVLIVEDDALLLARITDILTQAGYFVVGAPGPVGAVINLNLVQCDVVLLDLDMLRSDDTHSAQVLKSLVDSIPVVLITERNEAQQLAESLGMRGWLVKPFDNQDLLRVVADCCRSYFNGHGENFLNR